MLKYLALVLGVPIFLLTFCLSHIKRRLYFFPLKGIEHFYQDSQLNQAYIDLYLTVGTNGKIHVRKYTAQPTATPDQPSPRYILFCHGNAGNISTRHKTAEAFAKAGYNFVMFDYEGYGASTGIPSEEALYRDGDAVWKWLSNELPYDQLQNQMIVIGDSLGTAVAVHLAYKYHPRYLVLKNGMINIAALFPTFRPILNFLCPEFQVLKKLQLYYARASEARTLVYHTKDDAVIPVSHGYELAQYASIHSLTGVGGHNIPTEVLIPLLPELCGGDPSPLA